MKKSQQFNPKIASACFVVAALVVAVLIIYFFQNRNPEAIVNEVLSGAADETVISSGAFKTNFVRGYFPSTANFTKTDSIAKYSLTSTTGFREAKVSLYEKSAGESGPTNVEVARFTLVKQLNLFWTKWKIKTIEPIDPVLSQSIGNLILTPNTTANKQGDPISIGALTVKFDDFKATHIPQSADDFIGLTQSVEIDKLDQFAKDDSWSYMLKNVAGDYCGDQGTSVMGDGSNSKASINFNLDQAEYKSCQPDRIEIISDKFGKFDEMVTISNAQNLK